MISSSPTSSYHSFPPSSSSYPPGFPHSIAPSADHDIHHSNSGFDNIPHHHDPLLNPTNAKSNELPPFSAAESVLRFLAAAENEGVRTDVHAYGAAFGENDPFYDSTLPSSTTSVIRPFLYDTILSPTQLPTKYLEDDYYSIPFYPPELSVNLPPYRSNMLDNPNMNMQSMNGGTMNGGGVAGKMYSAVPPPGYICKLCFVEGHWLKNCTQYQSRRSSQPLFPLTTPLKPTPQSQSLYRPQKTSTPPPGYVCRKCNTPGHWIQQCVIPNRSLNGPPEGYTCKICWVKGHWIGQCPLRGRC